MIRFAGRRKFACREGVAVLRKCLGDKEKLPTRNQLINPIPALRRPGLGFLRQATSRAMQQAMIGLERP
ncbi:MAG: hypothetical protein LBG06_01495 [Deltaproteobacteria bacterium]|nr:hypothetical protein [Deltaproteobacteria bacterium]